MDKMGIVVEKGVSCCILDHIKEYQISRFRKFLFRVGRWLAELPV